MIGERRQELAQGLATHLAADVETMVGAHQPGPSRLGHRIGHRGQIAHARAIGANIADREGIEHGGNPRRDNLRIVRHHRRRRRPPHARTRREVLFQSVGMKLDQAGYQPIAAEVDGARKRTFTFVDAGDLGAADHHRSGEHAARGHHGRVGEYRLRTHPFSISSRFYDLGDSV